jgi:uncharacterized protein YjeT (DUF2065 family)
LALLRENVASNALGPGPPPRVAKLAWGDPDPLAALGLARAPDVVLASDVVYGNDPEKWRRLVRTLSDMSDAKTLVLVGNVRRYPVNHPLAETRFFEEATAEAFHREEVPAAELHAAHRKTGGGSCVVHVFAKKKDNINEEKNRPAANPRGGEAREGRRRGGRRSASETPAGMKASRAMRDAVYEE